MIGSTHIGIGNPDRERLSNQGDLADTQKAMLDEAIPLWFDYWSGCDYQLGPDAIEFGIEPAYFGDNLKIISIARDKDESYYATGRAFGMWGSGVRSKVRRYGDYTRKSKFTEFVDKWHPLIYPESSE